MVPDNNRVENSIRPVGFGSKYYLFARSLDAAQRSGIFYSLLGTCMAHGLDPDAGLKDVLARLPCHPQNRIRELLPQYYKACESDKGFCSGEQDAIVRAIIKVITNHHSGTPEVIRHIESCILFTFISIPYFHVWLTK
jgi:hypothetical protein